MEETEKSRERPPMTSSQTTSMIPAHLNIVEMVALLDDPQLRPKERTELRRILHDTVHFVRKQDSTVLQADTKKV